MGRRGLGLRGFRVREKVAFSPFGGARNRGNSGKGGKGPPPFSGFVGDPAKPQNNVIRTNRSQGRQKRRSQTARPARGLRPVRRAAGGRHRFPGPWPGGAPCVKGLSEEPNPRFLGTEAQFDARGFLVPVLAMPKGVAGETGGFGNMHLNKEPARKPAPRRRIQKRTHPDGPRRPGKEGPTSNCRACWPSTSGHAGGICPTRAKVGR